MNYFTQENAGEYTCIAENEYGERAYETFRVDLLKSGQPPFIRIEPKTIEAYEGSSLTINYTFTVNIYFLALFFYFQLNIFNIIIIGN